MDIGSAEMYQSIGLNKIPTGWEIKEINEVALINPDSFTSQTDGELLIQYIDIESVSEGKINNYKPFLFKDAPSRARRKVAEKDIIISTVRPYLKAFAMIEDMHPNTICSTGFAVLRAIEGITVPEYLYQFISSDIFLNQLLGKMVGSNYPAVNTTEFKKTIIAIPTSLYEQKKISEILNTIDCEIQKTEQLIDKYKRIKQGLIQDLFTRGVQSNGRLRPSYEEAPELYKESRIGYIPKEWNVCKSSDYCISIADGTHDTPKPQSQGVPLYTSKNLTEYNKLDKSEYYFISDSDAIEINKRSYVQKYDILFGMIGTVGNPVIIQEDDLNFAVKNVCIFRFDGDQQKSLWFYYVLNSNFMRRYFSFLMDGSTQKFISLSNLRNFYIPIPEDKNEMERINQVLFHYDKLIEREYERMKKASKIKQALMQDLLTGKIRVKVEGDRDE